jgi:hypothetical protein
MNRRVLWCGLAVAVATLLVAGEVVSQEKGSGKPDKGTPPPEKKPTTQPAGGEDMAKMMEAMTKLGAPGEYHKHLEGMIGSWNVAGKFWMAPDAELQESKGTSEMKWMLGGRFVMHEYSGQFQDMPVNGVGYIGYDNMKKQYVSVWLDTMSTAIYTETGECDASAKTFTFKGAYDDPMTGQKKNTKTVIKVISPDKFTNEMYEVGSDGKEFKNLELVYTRKASASPK